MIKMERTYTINIRKSVIPVPRHKRTNRAVKALQQFIARHFKTQNFRLGPKLNELMWSRSNKNPPLKFKVTGTKDEKAKDAPVLVELFGFKYPVKEEKKEEKKAGEKKAEEKPAADKKAEAKPEAPKKAKEPEMKEEAPAGSNEKKG